MKSQNQEVGGSLPSLDVKQKTEWLATYITNIYSEWDPPFFNGGRIFDCGLTHHLPLLKSGRINRILLYLGAFNPPHRGHLQLLQHAFENSGHDMNIIAAVIVSRDDDFIAQKCPGDQLRLSQDQRIRLWRGDHAPSDWFWVHPGTTGDWKVFQGRLLEMVKEDGFDLEFTILSGPDYYQTKAILSKLPFGWNEVVVSDVSRDADFTYRFSGHLKILKDCSNWEKITIDRGELRRLAQQNANWVYSGLYIMAPNIEPVSDRDLFDKLASKICNTSVSNHNNIRVCRGPTIPELKIRFVPGSRNSIRISSSHIREVIEAHSQSDMHQALRDKVLNVDILIEFLMLQEHEGRK